MTARQILACRVDELDDGEALLIPEDETGTGGAIAVFRDGDAFHALDDTCTHARASLSEGWVAEGQVECPLHGGAFCLRTGAAVAPPAVAAVRSHPVLVRDGAVWVELAAPSC